MRRADFQPWASDSALSSGVPLSRPALPPGPLELSTAAYLLGDLFEDPADWQNAWIDLGGEG